MNHVSGADPEPVQARDVIWRWAERCGQCVWQKSSCSRGTVIR
jgi:hypothetical protein